MAVHEREVLELKRGTMIGGTYQVLEPLGKGGQSEVWLVLHKRICSLLALKRIPLRARWPRGELDYARHLDHPGLPRIYDVFEAEGYICIVMEYLEGKTLEQLKQEKGSFSEKELLLWLRQLSGDPGISSFPYTAPDSWGYQALQPDDRARRQAGSSGFWSLLEPWKGKKGAVRDESLCCPGAAG